jgi:hypothetical protein
MRDRLDAILCLPIEVDAQAKMPSLGKFSLKVMIKIYNEWCPQPTLHVCFYVLNNVVK